MIDFTDAIGCCLYPFAASAHRVLLALYWGGIPLSRFAPQTLGGDRLNIWNDSIARITISYRETHLDRRLNVHTRLQNRKPIWNFIRTHGCKTILEIGLGTGENMEKMLELVGENCNYYCFDDLNLLEGLRTFQKLKGRGNVHFYIGDTKKVLPEVISQLPKMDAIFIDGGHDYGTVKSDWENCKRLMHPHTAVFFHDSDCIAIKTVVDEISDEFSVEIIKPIVGPQLALVRKKKGARG